MSIVNAQASRISSISLSSHRDNGEPAQAGRSGSRPRSRTFGPNPRTRRVDQAACLFRPGDGRKRQRGRRPRLPLERRRPSLIGTRWPTDGNMGVTCSATKDRQAVDSRCTARLDNAQAASPIRHLITLRKALPLPTDSGYRNPRIEGRRGGFPFVSECIFVPIEKEKAVHAPKPCPVCGSAHIDHCPNQVICRACLFITSPDYWDKLPRWNDLHASASQAQHRRNRHKGL